MTQEPMEAWTDYAKRSGLLNDQGVAEDRAKAQTAYFAFVAAWNLSWEANKHLASQQPEQEPVGYWKEHAQGMQRDYDLLLADYEKLAQRTWVGLTEEEIEYVWRKVETSDFHDCVQPLAQAIENIVKEKNNA